MNEKTTQIIDLVKGLTILELADLVKALEEDGSTVLMIFGGAPCSREWVEEIGGDGYSASGSEIVALVNRLLSDENREVSP